MMNMWCVRVCDLNPLVVYFNVKTHDTWEGKRTNKKWDFNWEHPFPRVYGYKLRSCIKEGGIMDFKTDSHTRLRAHDRYTSSTLIGGKGIACPSSLHTTLEGPTEYVNAWWMYSLHDFLHGIKWIMFHGHLDYFQNYLLEVGLTQNWETMHCKRSQILVYYVLSCVRTRININSLK